jgi:hypothetical protein
MRIIYPTDENMGYLSKRGAQFVQGRLEKSSGNGTCSAV